MKLFFTFFSCLLILSVISGCNNPEGNEENIELHIAAASNLVQAFTELGQQFEADYNIKVNFSFGSSGQLTEQILNGAPYDIFAPANSSFFQNLQESALLKDDQPIFAIGRIGIATLKDQNISVSNLEDVLNGDIKKIAIANPEHAPYGLAAKQALEQTGIWEAAEEKIVYGRNISDTLTLLETKNVEAAFIALSLKNEDVNFYLIDEDTHTSLEQPISALKTTKFPEQSDKFIQFLFTDKAQEILEKHGYSIP